MTAIAIAPPANVAARPLEKPPDGMPAEVLGELCTYVWKPMLGLGEIEHPKLGWTYNVTEDEAKELVAEGQRYIANGNKPFLPDKHMEVYDANANNGYIPKFEFKDGVVWGLHQLIGEEARKKAAKNDTSVFVEFGKRDGKGQTYKKVISHNALCPDPVAPGLGGFFAMSQSTGIPEFVIALGGYNHGCNQYGCKGGGGEGDDKMSSALQDVRSGTVNESPGPKASGEETKLVADELSKAGGFSVQPDRSNTMSRNRLGTSLKEGDKPDAGYKALKQSGFTPVAAQLKQDGDGKTEMSSWQRGKTNVVVKATLDASGKLEDRDEDLAFSMRVYTTKASLSVGSIAMCSSGEICQCDKCRAAQQGDDMKLTPEQLARAKALGLTDLDDDNAADRLLALAEANGKKLAASVSVLDRPADYLLSPILQSKAEKAMQRGISKAAIDKVVGAFSGADKKLANLAFSQSASGSPVIFDVLDALAENVPVQTGSSFSAQSFALSGSTPTGDGQSEEDKAITATLQANGLAKAS